MSIQINESSLLFLNTKDSINPELPHDTTWVLNNIFASNFDDYTLAVQSIEIPNLRYPINRLTDKIYFKENGGITITSTLTNQNYTPLELATAIASLMTADGGIGETYTGTFDLQKYKISIIPSNGLNSITYVAGVNDSSEITGLTQGIFLGGGLGNEILRLDGTTYIEGRTNLNTGNYSSNSSAGTLFRIPLLAPFGAIAFYQQSTDDFLNISSDSLQTLDLRLYDDKDRLYILPPNANVSITLKILPVYT